jgi:uncharacterized membrane-anchored protein YjiN (DUF445 family)
MTISPTTRDLPAPAPGSAEAELARTKRAATILLAGAFVTALIARAIQHLHPALGFLAAFAEAATVGGLADWFAVVALFRHPLGLPIPHTAIIPNNRHRIATSLGEFVQVHFLGADVVAAKLKSIDFVDVVRRWLEVPRNSAGVAQTILRLLPQFTHAFEHSGAASFALRFVRGQASRIDFAPLAGDLIELLVKQGHHRQLFDAGLAGIAKLLGDKGTLETIRAKIKEELPALFNFFRADAILLKRIVTSTFALTEEIRNDPDHPLRAEFDAFLKKFARDLRDNPRQYSETIRDFAETLGNNPELGNVLGKLFSALMEAIREGARESSSQLTLSLTRILVEAGAGIDSEPHLKAYLNEAAASALATIVERRKGGISRFISDQVDSWDMKELISIIEVNAGRDLQYIRFNGTIIGGLAGLALHTVEYVARL